MHTGDLFTSLGIRLYVYVAERCRFQFCLIILYRYEVAGQTQKTAILRILSRTELIKNALHLNERYR